MTEQERLKNHLWEYWDCKFIINPWTGRVQGVRPRDMSLAGFWEDVGVMASMHNFVFTEARCNSHEGALRVSFVVR